jgi:hypothetical protein
MRANYRTETKLQSAIEQLRDVARKKRAQSRYRSRDKTALVQEAKQLDEAVRLLRWIS